jgi:hypothetical protein
MRRMGSSKPINYVKVSAVYLFFGALLILQRSDNLMEAPFLSSSQMITCGL